MPKIDVYLRSIERFGAAGAILASGQAVTMRFPQGDRHATQVTPHDQLVALVREIAPPVALDQIDANRPAKFDMDSNGIRYSLSVVPKPGFWQVTIEGAPGATPAVAPSPATGPVPRQPRAGTAPTTADAGTDMAIERGQYSEGSGARATSGSVLLDGLTSSARSARATDVYLATGAHPVMRVFGELQPVGDRGSLDAETISRELGIVAPAEARGAWSEKGMATFTYGDGIGRVRATLTRDHRGPGASLRLLVGEPPALERLGMGREVGEWLGVTSGLVIVAGPSGSGKTTTLAALVRALGEKRRRVIAFEDPIEIIHVTNPWVSQRGLRDHASTIGGGVATAMREAADAIVIGAVSSSDAAVAVLEAVLAGHLVLITLAATSAHAALDRLVDLLPADRRELGRSTLDRAVLGTIAPVVTGTSRSFEVLPGRT